MAIETGQLIAVCSAKPRPKAARSCFLKTGASSWGRDVYHLRYSGMTTYCGRDLTEWLTIGPIEKLDTHCCVRCSAEFARRNAAPATPNTPTP